GTAPTMPEPAPHRSTKQDWRRVPHVTCLSSRPRTPSVGWRRSSPSRPPAFTRLDVSPIVQGLAIAAAALPAAPPPHPSLAAHSSTSVSNQMLNVTFYSRSSASGTPAFREIRKEG